MMAESKCDWVWHNGKWVRWENANVHISTWSLHYSVAIFEGIRCYPLGRGKKGNSYIFRLPEHAHRLVNSAKIYEMNLRYSQRQIEKAVLETVRKNRLKGCYIRPLLYFGQWKSPSPTKRQLSTELSIFALPAHENLERWERSRGIRCMISSWRKPAASSLPADAKCSANYATSYLAALEAERAGYDYAFLLDQRGFLSEGLASNVFIVMDGELLTPPPYASILLGVTRDSVLTIAKDEGIRWRQRDIMPSELLKADEVFVSGTASDITPVVEVDGVKIGDGKEGPVTATLQKIYHEALTGKDERYRDWLTPVY